MKIYHNDKRVYSRDEIGQFKKGKSIKYVLIFIGIVMAIALIAQIEKGFEAGDAQDRLFYEVKKVEAKEPDRLEAKISELKQDVLEKLSQCEAPLNHHSVKGQPEGTIIFDSNNEPSIGPLMYQRDTVIRYVKMFHNKDINRRQAIELAIDTEQAFDLGEKIIFEDDVDNVNKRGGIWNWKNCANKLGLQSEVELIEKLSE